MEIAYSMSKRFTMVDNETGYITFGPKDNFHCCVQINYLPTQAQIENLRKFFGWDYITLEEYKKL